MGNLAAEPTDAPPLSTPQDVVRALVQMNLEGRSLRSRRMVECNQKLLYAAQKHYGNWGNALRAAGFDPEVIANRRTWTKERVLNAIHRLEQQGIALNYGTVIKSDYGLPQAAAKRFGSWSAALRAAGIDPDAVRQARKPWAREEVIEVIHTRAAAGLPIASYNVKPASAEVASRRLFGSWRAALRAAGVPNPSTAFPIWTKVSVIEGILIRQQAGRALHAASAANTESRLYDAARRHFGSWRQALKEAGIDPESVRKRRRPWMHEEIIAELRRVEHEKRDPANLRNYTESFVKAARRLLGSWQQTLNSAGVSSRPPRP